MVKRNFILFVLTLLAASQLYAQQLLPFTENFTKYDYSGDNQVWSAIQGSDKAMYFANNHFLLRYNGVKWEKYTLPDKTIIRSVFAYENRVYSGSYKEFGYWERHNGSMAYTSLSRRQNLFTGNSGNEEVWKIFSLGKKIYFQSFNELYVYDGRTISKLLFPSQISYCYVCNNTIYAATVRNGVYKLNGKTFTPVPGWDILKDKIIHGIEKINGTYYIFTKNNGVYTGTEFALHPWDMPVNKLLKANVILTTKIAAGNTLIVGTALEGVYIINLQKGSYQNINRKNGLKNNAVLSINTDAEQDLWLGLDNGISHIEISSPVSIFTDNSGLLGSVYSLASLPGNSYLLATNHGIFNYSAGNLAALPNAQGQVWDIYPAGSNFIIGHNDGTFIYNNLGLKKINPVNGGWKFLQSRYDNAFFQANYSGIVVYKDVNNLASWKVLDSITKPIRNIAQNKPGELWAADNYRSLYRILYDTDFNVTRVENVSAKNKIGADFGVKLFSYRNEVLFYINNTWYQYNELEAKLEKNILFNKEFKDISDIISINDDSFVVIKSGLLYTISVADSGFSWRLLPEKYYRGRLLAENTQAHIKDGKLYINLDDGFMCAGVSGNNTTAARLAIEGYYEDKLINEGTNIKYNGAVGINILSGYYGYSRPELYYKLNDGPYTPVKDGYIALNNLGSGRQELKLYSNSGLKYTYKASYIFTVGLPWYFSSGMILGYIAVLAGIFFLYYRWNQLRYTQKVQLNEEELRHRTQLLELEMEAERKLRQQEFEKHLLETEVQTKASEVAGKSLSIAKHSEMIDSIQQALEDENSGESLKSRIRKIIKTNSINKNEWQSFEKNLIKSHEEFVERLSNKYPALTSKDIKLCIYLKMNLSSKEIAPLMNISFRGVELHRYRLRKKLDITTDESLSKFMITI